MQNFNLSKFISENRENLIASKLIMHTAHHFGILLETVRLSIKKEYEYYKDTGNREYLEMALIIICAYLELGVPSNLNESGFDLILVEFNIKNWQELLFHTSKKRLPANKNSVNQMLVHWNYPSPGGMKKQDVINDIIFRINKGKPCSKTYKNCKGYSYDLVITQEGEKYLYNDHLKIYNFFK